MKFFKNTICKYAINGRSFSMWSWAEKKAFLEEYAFNFCLTKKKMTWKRYEEIRTILKGLTYAVEEI